jgi:hypothetical protein
MQCSSCVQRRFGPWASGTRTWAVSAQTCQMALTTQNNAMSEEHPMPALLPVDTTLWDFTPTPITDDEAAAMFRAVSISSASGVSLTRKPQPSSICRFGPTGAGRRRGRPDRPRRQGAAVPHHENLQSVAHHLARTPTRLCLDQGVECHLRWTDGTRCHAGWRTH